MDDGTLQSHIWLFVYNNPPETDTAALNYYIDWLRRL